MELQGPQGKYIEAPKNNMVLLIKEEVAHKRGNMKHKRQHACENQVLMDVLLNRIFIFGAYIKKLVMTQKVSLLDEEPEVIKVMNLSFLIFSARSLVCFARRFCNNTIKAINNFLTRIRHLHNVPEKNFPPYDRIESISHTPKCKRSRSNIVLVSPRSNPHDEKHESAE